jgi:hypothetical protein
MVNSMCNSRSGVYSTGCFAHSLSSSLLGVLSGESLFGVVAASLGSTLAHCLFGHLSVVVVVVVAVAGT